MMNCLSYALNFWSEHPEYLIYYNGDHCINLRDREVATNYLSLSGYGLEHMMSSFQNTLNKEDIFLLKQYFEYITHKTDFYWSNFEVKPKVGLTTISKK